MEITNRSLSARWWTKPNATMQSIPVPWPEAFGSSCSLPVRVCRNYSRTHQCGEWSSQWNRLCASPSHQNVPRQHWRSCKNWSGAHKSNSPHFPIADGLPFDCWKATNGFWKRYRMKNSTPRSADDKIIEMSNKLRWRLGNEFHRRNYGRHLRRCHSIWQKQLLPIPEKAEMLPILL